MRRNQHSGFTLIEFMFVVALGSILSMTVAQSYQQDAMQSLAKKLGKTEIATYTGAVQNYLIDHAATPSAIDGEVHNGVNWLKSAADCPGIGTGAEGYLPCNFLVATNESTTYGDMDFTTTITFNSTSTATSPEGLEARTVLSKFATEDPGKTSGYVLGLAALVASTESSSGFGSGSSPAATFYCPDMPVMPATIAAYCGAERDRLVSYAFTNGENDVWIRTDHGNTVKSAIEYRPTNDTPSTDAELDAIDARNKRHLRNVARIYNLNNAGTNGGPYENLIIGAKNGNAAIGMMDIASNGVIIDADMQVLGEIIADGNIRSKANVQGQQFVDEDDNTFLLDPNATSSLEQVDLNQLSSLGTTLDIRADEVVFDDKAGGNNGSILRGVKIEKNGTTYDIEELLPNFTFISSHLIRQPYSQSISDASMIAACGGLANIRVMIVPLVDEIVTNQNVGGQIRRVTHSGSRFYYRPENALYTDPNNKEARNSQAILQFYCAR